MFFLGFLGFSRYLRSKSQRHWSASRSQRSRGCRHGHVWLSGEAESQSQKINLLPLVPPSTPTRHLIVLFLILTKFVLFSLCAILCEFWSLWHRWTHPQTLLVPELAHQFGSLSSGSVHDFFVESEWRKFSLSSNRHEPWQFLRLTFFEVSKFWMQIKNDLKTVGRCCYCCFLCG